MFKIAFQIVKLKGNHKRQDLATFRWLYSYLIKHSCKFDEIIRWPTLFAGNRGCRNSECKRGVCNFRYKISQCSQVAFFIILIELEREKRKYCYRNIQTKLWLLNYTFKLRKKSKTTVIYFHLLQMQYFFPPDPPPPGPIQEHLASSSELILFLCFLFVSRHERAKEKEYS